LEKLIVLQQRDRRQPRRGHPGSQPRHGPPLARLQPRSGDVSSHAKGQDSGGRSTVRERSCCTVGRQVGRGRHADEPGYGQHGRPVCACAGRARRAAESALAEIASWLALRKPARRARARGYLGCLPTAPRHAPGPPCRRDPARWDHPSSYAHRSFCWRKERMWLISPAW
jgi:hypothetical protein